MDDLNPSPTICGVCSNVLFKEDVPIHFRCFEAREESLIEMVTFLQSQINDMKRAMKSVENVMENIGMVLNFDNELVPEVNVAKVPSAPALPPAKRNVRPATRQKSELLSKQMSQKKKRTKKSKVSPLVIPNVTSQPDDEIIISVNKNRTSVSTVSSKTGQPPSTFPVPTESAASSSVSVPSPSQQPLNLNVPDHDTSDCGLTIIPPPKSVFLSRVGNDVTTEQVENYIKKSISSADGFTVRKLLFRNPREFSSFEISVGSNLDLFKSLLESRMWPPYAVVHEFKHFLKDRRTRDNLW